MKIKINLILAIVLCASLLSLVTTQVHAATCTWNGLSNNDWTYAANWSDCGGLVPGESDDVIIPDVDTDPSIPEMTAINIGELTMQTGSRLSIPGSSTLTTTSWTNSGTLEVNAADAPVWLYGSGQFVNQGRITKIGVDDLIIYGLFSNSGTLDIQGGNVTLNRGGTHTGEFDAVSGSSLAIGGETTGQTFNFESDSLMKVSRLFIRAYTVNFSGTYWPPAAGSRLDVQPSSGNSTLIFTTGANIVNMPELVSVSNSGKLIFESPTAYHSIYNLNIRNGGELNNLGELSVSNSFIWYGGIISGAGTTTVLADAAFTIRDSTHTLDGQTLINSAVANWNSGAISMTNNALFQNSGTFNANATTTMSADTGGAFTNDGDFYKSGVGTTTTMNIEFTNTGNVEVLSGTLSFPMGLTSGDGTVVDLGTGSIGSGTGLTLTSGASLVGSGTLDGDLNNGGEVSPGSSPGLITVNGDYVQTEDGVLTMELAGTTPGSEYDQLSISGIATLEGTLDVILINDFQPSAGESFSIMTYGSHSGTFETVNLDDLPSGLKWVVDYDATAVTLTVGQDKVMVFLPLVTR